MTNVIEIKKHKRKRYKNSNHGNGKRGWKIRYIGIFIVLASAWYAYEFLLPRVSITGYASVVDGDTLTLNSKRIRLHAYDAPEALQTCEDVNGKEYACGSVATQKLKELVNGHEVTCSKRKVDKYDRIVATCSVAGNDIGKEMVRSGNAVAYFYYSWRLTPMHFEAMILNKGIWAGSFINPYQWRKSHRYECKLCGL